jgi:mono/diheme cytochrome c family protein
MTVLETFTPDLADSLWKARPMLVLFVANLVLGAIPPTAVNEPAKLTRRERGDLAIAARAILKKHCAECHAGENSRRTFSVLEHSRLVAAAPNPIPFIVPGNAGGSQAIEFIRDGSMPPGNRPRLTREEIGTLEDWIAASAPSYPAAFDDRATLQAMLDDIARQPTADVPYLRYVSLAHLVPNEGTPKDLKGAETRLTRALASCRVKSPPEPVDDTATLFRLDLRKAGWDYSELFARQVNRVSTDVVSLTPYDVLLLEYPFGFRLPGGDPLAGKLEQYFSRAKPIERIPFIRGDWMEAALDSDRSLAEDLCSLIDLGAALKKQDYPPQGKEEKMPCGLPVREAFNGKLPPPAGPSPILPIGSWYLGGCQTEPPPIKVQAQAVDLGGKPVKSVPLKQPFRLQVTADRDCRFVLLMVWSDGTVVVQPTNKGGVLKAEERTMLAPKETGAFRIIGNLSGDAVGREYFILLVSQDEVPVPAILQSRHSRNQICEEKKRFPISRFVFDPATRPADFDSSRIVRTVIPLEIEVK